MTAVLLIFPDRALQIRNYATGGVTLIFFLMQWSHAILPRLLSGDNVTVKLQLSSLPAK